jgi:FK506-binding protein 4/5
LKLGNYEECKRASHFAITLDPDNEKVLFRRGQCQLASRNFNEAIEDFEAVLRKNPSNTAAIQQIEQCHKEIKAYKVKEKELYNSFLDKKARANAARKVRHTFS